MNKKGLLLVMSGPSGTGKGTVCEELKKDESIFVSVSMTSRNMRENEIDGVTYYYVSPQQFEDNIKNEKMLEWAQYNGNYYGTPREAVEKMLDEGKNVLLEIEVQGALQVKKNFKDAVLIFIVPPSIDILRQRLIDRGRESLEEIENRINTAKWEITKAPEYNYIIVNDDLSECVDDVFGIIKAEGHKTENNLKIIENLKF